MIEFSAADQVDWGQLVDVVHSHVETRKKTPKVDQRIFAGEKAVLGRYSFDFRISTNGCKLDIYDLITSIMRGISERFLPQNIAYVKVLVISPLVNVRISLVQDPMQVGGVKGGRHLIGDGELVLNARVMSMPERLRNGIEAACRRTSSALKNEVLNWTQWSALSLTKTRPSIP